MNEIEKYHRLREQLENVLIEYDLLTAPPLTDLNRIGEIYEALHNERDHRGIFIAVVLRLYSPESLWSDRKVRDFVATTVADVLGTKLSYVSRLIPSVRMYYTRVKAFRERVDELVPQFLE